MVNGTKRRFHVSLCLVMHGGRRGKGVAALRLQRREPHDGLGTAAACGLSGGALLTLEDLPAHADGDFADGDAFAGVGHGFFHHTGKG